MRLWAEIQIVTTRYRKGEYNEGPKFPIKTNHQRYPVASYYSPEATLNGLLRGRSVTLSNNEAFRATQP